MDIVHIHCAGLDVHKKTVAAVHRYPFPAANLDNMHFFDKDTPDNPALF